MKFSESQRKRTKTRINSTDYGRHLEPQKLFGAVRSRFIVADSGGIDGHSINNSRLQFPPSIGLDSELAKLL